MTAPSLSRNSRAGSGRTAFADRPDLANALNALASADVVRQAKGRFWLTDEARAIAAELTEPMPFRLWREVENARKKIEQLGADPSVGSELLSARLGVELDQAREFLNRYPLEAQPLTSALRKNSSRRRIWAAANFRATPKKPLDNASQSAALAEALSPAASNRDNARELQPLQIAARDENTPPATQVQA